MQPLAVSATSDGAHRGGACLNACVPEFGLSLPSVQIGELLTKLQEQNNLLFAFGGAASEGCPFPMADDNTLPILQVQRGA